MFGYGPAELRTLEDWWRLAYPDPAYRASVVARWNIAAAAAQDRTFQGSDSRVTCKNGSERIMVVFGMNIDDGVLAAFLDVTERAQAEADLQRQAEELSASNDELERFNRAMVGRELDMIALKQRVNELSRELGREPPYRLAMLDDGPTQARRP